MVTTNFPQETCFSALFSTTHIRVSTSDITTLPVIGSNKIFQKISYSENSTISLRLRRQAVWFLRVKVKVKVKQFHYRP